MKKSNSVKRNALITASKVRLQILAFTVLTSQLSKNPKDYKVNSRDNEVNSRDNEILFSLILCFLILFNTVLGLEKIMKDLK